MNVVGCQNILELFTSVFEKLLEPSFDHGFFRRIELPQDLFAFLEHSIQAIVAKADQALWRVLQFHGEIGGEIESFDDLTDNIMGLV